MNPANLFPSATRARHTGVALAISLILLLVITLVGITAIRLTTIQQKITANFYDREVAFQSAEAGVVAAAQLLAGGVVADRNCSATGDDCRVNPFTDPNYAGSIHDVASGTGSGHFTVGGNAATGCGEGDTNACQPQYIIENMGQWADPSSDTGFNQTANAAQYGAPSMSVMRTYYRITTRSGDPAEIGDRAVVTLQAMYRQ